MKVELNKFERDVILQALNPYDICSSSCYMEYGERIHCDTLDENNEPKCKLLKTIQTIEKKLGVV